MVGMNHMVIAREADYGTPPANGWLGLDVENLGGHTPVVAVQQPQVMRYGLQGPSTHGRRAIERGATGSIPTYLTSRGLQVLLDATFGLPDVTELAPGQAWSYVYETDSIASLVSFSTQVAREFKGGTLDRDTFAGGQVGQMTLTQGLASTGGGTSDEGLSKIAFDVNYQRRVPGEANHLPTYEDPELYFSGGDHTLSIGSSLSSLDAECLTEWTLTVPTGLDFEDRCISTQNRDQASRGSLPAPTIQMAWSYKHRDYYDAWLNGEILALRSRWQPTGAIEIATGVKPSFTVDVAAFGLTGEVATESMTESTKQNLPSEVLHNGTDPMIKITVVSSEPPYEEES